MRPYPPGHFAGRLQDRPLRLGAHSGPFDGRGQKLSHSGDTEPCSSGALSYRRASTTEYRTRPDVSHGPTAKLVTPPAHQTPGSTEGVGRVRLPNGRCQAEPYGEREGRQEPQNRYQQTRKRCEPQDLGLG